MKQIIFPKNENTKYYESHYAFILNIIKEWNVPIIYSKSTALDKTRFTIKIDDETILIDFFDHPTHKTYYPQYKTFKYHYTEDKHEKYENMFPLGAISFLDWKQYYTLKKEIKYKSNSDLILNNQRIFGNAIKRRRHVRKLLKEKYGGLVDINLTNQYNFWQKINNCLVYVAVPGARNDMLDRGQFQFMALGACTISPYLKTELAYKEKIMANIHYIKCNPDYSDLIDKIEWCKEHRKECIEIGKRAQALFLKTSTPDKIKKWMKICLKK